MRQGQGHNINMPNLAQRPLAATGFAEGGGWAKAGCVCGQKNRHRVPAMALHLGRGRVIAGDDQHIRLKV
jgi:hypothetical protein